MANFDDLQSYVVGNPDAQVTIVSGMASAPSSKSRKMSDLLNHC